MSTIPAADRRPVVVGIDGSQTGSYALAWAAEEAGARRVPLLVVYVADIPHRGLLAEATGRAVDREVSAYGRELLADALATVAEDFDHIEVSTTLLSGPAATAFVELSSTAELIVLGRGDSSALAHALLGSTARRVADRAACPVILVPAPPAAGPVVVGVSDSGNGRRAMDFACEQARSRGREVLAIRCLPELMWASAGVGFHAEVSFATLREGEQALLDREVGDALQRHPGVRITARLSDTPVETALSGLEEASLVVLGCRRSDTPHRPRLGPVTSWLIEHTAGAVAVTGQTEVPE